MDRQEHSILLQIGLDLQQTFKESNFQFITPHINGVIKYLIRRNRSSTYKGGKSRALQIYSETGPPSETTKCSTLGGKFCDGHGSNRSYFR